VLRLLVAMVILMTLRSLSCAALQERRVALLALRLVASLEGQALRVAPLALRLVSSLEGQALRVTLLALRLVASLEGQALRVTLLALRLVASLAGHALRVALLALRLEAYVLGHVALRLVSCVSGYVTLQLARLVGLAEQHPCFVLTPCLVVDYCPRHCYRPLLPTMRTCYGEVSGKDSSETHHLRRETRTSLVFLLRSSRAVTTADLSLNPHCWHCCRVRTADLSLNPHCWHCCRVTTAHLSLNPHCCRVTGNLHSNPRYSCVKMNCRNGHCLAKMPSLCLIASRPATLSASLSAQPVLYDFD